MSIICHVQNYVVSRIMNIRTMSGIIYIHTMSAITYEHVMSRIKYVCTINLKLVTIKRSHSYFRDSKSFLLVSILNQKFALEKLSIGDRGVQRVKSVLCKTEFTKTCTIINFNVFLLTYNLSSDLFLY